MGRTTTYTEDVAEEIVERLSTGEPLAQICRDDHMPAARTVGDWRVVNETFAAAIARAREDGFDRIAADALTIIDTLNEDPASRRVRLDGRLKLLAKWDPKRYGDKVALTNAEGGSLGLVALVAASQAPEGDK